MMLELIRPVIILLGLTFYDWIPGLLDEPFGLPERYVKLICGAGVIVAILVADYLLRRWTSIRYIRRKRFPYSEFEGLWFQRVGRPERPYSIGKISYSSSEDRWVYSGVGYDKGFKPAAEWATTSLHYDKSSRNWYFAGEAHILKFDPGVKGYFQTDIGYVRPVLALPDERDWRGADKVDGTVVDLYIHGKTTMFSIKLTRADHLYQGKLPTVDQLKATKPSQVEQRFREMGLLEDSPHRS